MLTRSSSAALALGLVGLLALALAVGFGPLPVDATDAALVALRRAGYGAGLLDAFDLAGSLPVWGALVLALATAACLRNRWSAIEILLVAAASEVGTTLVKLLVSRPRPAAVDVTDLLAAGFPSGHVTRTAVIVGVVLVLLGATPTQRRLVVVGGVTAVAVMALARVSAGAHHTSDVLGGLFLAAVVLGGWAMWRGRFAVDAVTIRSRTGTARGAHLVALVASPILGIGAAWLGAGPAAAASPTPGTGGGDPRSGGEGPGFVGDPATAIAVTVAIGAAAAAVTYAYVRLTRGRS